MWYEMSIFITMSIMLIFFFQVKLMVQQAQQPEGVTAEASPAPPPSTPEKELVEEQEDITKTIYPHQEVLYNFKSVSSSTLCVYRYYKLWLWVGNGSVGCSCVLLLARKGQKAKKNFPPEIMVTCN